MIFKTTDDGERIISFFNKAKIESENFAKQLEKDKAFLTEYFNATGDVAKQQAILNKSTNEASKSAIEYAVNTKGAAGSVSNFEQQQIKANASVQKSKKYFDLSTVSAGAYKLAIKGITIVANMATSALLSGVVYAFSKLFTAQNEAIEKAKELTSTYKSNNTSLEDYKEQINTLVTELNTSNISYEDSKTKRKELMSIQDELFKKYGTEEEVIKSITAAINGEVDALDTLSQKSYYEWLASVDSLTGAQKFGNGFFKIFTGISDQYKSALDSAVDYMEDKTQFFYVKTTGNEELDKLIQEKFDLYKNAFDEFVIKDMVPEEAYELLGQIRTAYRDNAGEYLGTETDNILTTVNDSIQSAMTTIDAELGKHQETYHTYLEGMIKYDSEYSDKYADLLSKRALLEEAELSTNDKGKQQRVLEAKKAFYDSLNNAITSAENNDNVKRYFENLYPDLYSEISSWNFEYSISANKDGIADTAKEIGEKYTATDLLNMVNTEGVQEGEESFNSLIDKAIEYGVCTDKSAEEVQKLIDLLVELGIVQDNVKGSTSDSETATSPLSISQTIDQLNTRLKPAFDSLKSAYQDIFTDDGKFALNSIDILSTCDTIKSKLDEMSDPAGLNLDVDYSAFEDFVRVLNNTESTKQDVEKAFDSLATSITQAAVTGAEDFETLKAALEDLGIVNEELVAFEALISNTEALKKAGLDLSSATDEQISAFANEIVSSENVSQAIAMLTFQKELFTIQDMDTSGEVANLIALAENAGYTGEVIQYLTELEQLYQQVSSGTLSPGNLDAKLARAKELEELIKGTASKINYEPKVSYKPGKGSGGGGSKSKKEKEEEFDWIEKAIENLEDEITKLDKVASSSYSSIIEKNEALAESIERIHNEMDLQRKAYEQYMEKAESVGLSDEYKMLIQSGDVDIESITDEDLKEAIKNYEQWYDKAKEAQDQTDDLYEKAKDKHVEIYELEAGEIEKLRENQAITEREYLDAMLALYEKYYAGQTEFANQAKEAKLKYLQEEKNYLNTVAEAASSLLDDQIDETEDEKDKARKVYEDEIARIEESIKAKEKEKDAIQLKIDALKDEGDELDRQKNLLDAIKSKEEALYDLERAKNQRSQMLYKDGQMVWDVDGSKIKEANQNVDDAQAAVDKAERDIQIADLQAQIDLIQDGIDALEDQKEQLEALADESDAFFDKKIADMNEYQNEWKKVLEFEERSLAIENLKSMFGEDAVEQILAHNTTLLDVWKQNCIDTMAAIDLATNGSVGAITQQWGELAGVSIDMDKAMELSELSMVDLKDKAQSLGITMGEVASASKEAGDALLNTDTSSVNEQMQITGQSAQDVQEQIKGVTDKLDTLSSDVQNCEIPPINSQQFVASLGGEDGNGGILGQLNTFIERFREICNEIPSIWNGMIQSISGQENASGQATGYDALFAPLLTAMDTAKTAIDTKLTEYAGAWTQFNTDLGAIIGISSAEKPEKRTGGKLADILGPSSANASASGKESAGDGTIVGTITAGGQAAAAALNEEWIPGFESFASSIDGICASVCTMTTDMANEVIDMVNAALKALKELQAKNTGAYKIDKVTSKYSSHAVGSSQAYGTLSSPDGNGAVARDQTSLVNELGNEMIARGGTLYEITGGAQEVQLKKGDIVFNHRQTEELKRYHRVTSGGGRGKLIGAFASGTANASTVSVLEGDIRELWDSDGFQELLEKISELKTGQDTIIEQNDGLLTDKDGNIRPEKNGRPHLEGSILTSDGQILTPLPDDHPDILMGNQFEAYVQKMGGPEFLSVNAMARHEQQMEDMLKRITNSTVVTNNHMQPIINMGGVTITCPGVTDQQVMKQVGIALEHEFTGLAMKAYQKSMISR